MSKIRGIPVEVVDEIVFETNVSEQHDFAYVTVYSDREERFETHDLVEIEGNIDYIVQTDRVTALDNNLFEHRVACFENLARFDKVIPAERVFSRITIDNGVLTLMTLGEIFSHYKRELEFYEGIDIDLKDDGTGYENVQIPLKEFSGGVNFTSIMFELFRRIKANPKVERNGNTWVFYPQYWYTRKNDISTRVQDVEAFMTQTNAEDYATQVKSLIKNGSSELLEATVFPSRNGYVLPKGDVPEPPTSRLKYEADSPILGIIKVTAVGVNLNIREITNNTLGSLIDTIFEDVDITEFVVTEQEFDSLNSLADSVRNNLLSGVNKRNAIRYQIGSRFITGLFSSATDTVFSVFSINTDHLRNAVSAAATIQFQDNYTEEIVAFAIEPTVTTPPLEVKNTKLRIEYIRERNVAVSAHRQYQGFMNETSVIHSQRDSRVEANRFKDNLDILANRMGNIETLKTLTVRDNEPLVEVFDYVGENVVVDVKNTQYQGVTLQEIKLSQNFVNANSEYAISRRLDPFTISGKRVTTNFLLNDFVEVSKTQKDIDSKLTFKGVENFLKTFANDTSAKPIEASVFKSLELNSKAIHMPIMKLTGGNLSFHAFFDNPRIAGFDYTGEFGQPIPYADNDGIVTNFNWFLTDDILIEDDGSYPDITDDFFAIQNNNAYSNPLAGFPADLDPQAAFAITYQINPIVDDNRFIIGEGFTKYNFLIEVQSLNFAVYGKNTPYTYQDIDIGEQVMGATFSFDIEQRRLTFSSGIQKPHFALVHNGEIILAFNETLSNNTYFINFATKIVITLIGTINETFSVSETVSGIAQEFVSVNVQETFGITETIIGFAQEFFEVPVSESFNINETVAGVAQQFFSGTISETFGLVETISGIVQEFLSGGVNETLSINETINGFAQQNFSGTISESFGVSENVAGEITQPPKQWVSDTSVASVWDVTVNLGLVSTCPTQQGGLSIIESNAPANSQSVGDRGRIVSAQEQNGAFLPCTERRYRVELE